MSSFGDKSSIFYVFKINKFFLLYNNPRKVSSSLILYKKFYLPNPRKDLLLCERMSLFRWSKYLFSCWTRYFRVMVFRGQKVHYYSVSKRHFMMAIFERKIVMVVKSVVWYCSPSWITSSRKSSKIRCDSMTTSANFCLIMNSIKALVGYQDSFKET